MPTQTIRYVVSGTNPQTEDVQIQVSPAGNASASIVLQSSAAGVDTIQAFLDAMDLSSNSGQVVWQGTNGPISLGPVTAYTMAGNGSGNFPAGLNASSFGAPQIFNSLQFNTHPQNALPGDPHQSGNTANPFVNNAITSSGSWAADVALNNSPGAFNMVLTGQMVIKQAGPITFTALVNSAFLIGVQGATFVSGTQTLSGVTTTPFNAFPVLAGFNGPNWVWPGQDWATTTFTLNFATPGVYIYEICCTAGVASERQFVLQANGAVIPPVTLITVPPAPAGSASGAQMTLTPTSTGPAIVGTAQTITVNLYNLVFETTPYLPILEGTAGSIFVANEAGSTGFAFPTLPQGGAVNPTDALAAILVLSGDNDSWQGKLALSWNGTGYTLSYNGSAVDPNIPTTSLSLKSSEIAWYNVATNTFDVYTVSYLGGGNTATIQVNWLVNATVSSYGPTSLWANATQQTVTFTLAKPLPPLQNNTTCTATGGTGITVTEVTTNTNSAGWITGWTVTVITANQLSASASSIALTVSGEQTYLSGTSFLTQTVTYMNAKSFAISLAAG